MTLRHNRAGVVLAVVLAVGGLSACGGSGSSSSSAGGTGGTGGTAQPGSAVLHPTMAGGVQVFDLHGTPQNMFSAATLEAKPGTVRVVLHVDSQSSPHNVTFDALGGAKTKDVDAGDTGEVTVQVPQPGVYTFSCTIHPGMRGALHVS